MNRSRISHRAGKLSLLLGLVLILGSLMPAVPAAAQPSFALAAEPAAPDQGIVSGTVFRDYNADGTQQTNQLVSPYLLEPGISGVIITAYDVNNAAAGTTTSGTNGAYSFTASGTLAGGFRVEFTLPANGSLNFLQAGAAGPTTVVMVPTGGQTGLNVGFNNPIDYSQVDPDLITPRAAFGPRSGLPAFTPGSPSEQPNESIIGIGYNQNGDLAATNLHDTYATLAQTGSLYGMTYQRRSKVILAGTYFKSYIDTGPIQASGWLQNVSPLGAIYGVQVLSGTPNPLINPAKVYANLNKIIDPGTGVVVPSNPAGVDPRRTGTINYDSGTLGDCDGSGTGGAPSDGESCWRHDPVAWDKVGSIGLGDLEENDTESLVYVVNLADKKLYQLPIDPTPANWPITTLAASPVAIPNTCAVSSDAVPGALGFSDGKLYVGVTCTAKSTQNASQLKAEVWRFDPATQTFGASPVFSTALGYPRGCIFAEVNTGINLFGVNAPKNVGTPLRNCQPLLDGSSNTIDNANWLPWPQTWQAHFQNNSGRNSPGKPGWDVTGDGNAVQLEYPHPWLSDISFDGNDLVMGFRDINGDRTGNIVRSPNVNPTDGAGTNNFPSSGTPLAAWMSTYAYDYAGAGLGDLLRACWNGSGWTLENNGTCGSVTTPGANNGQGPSTAGTYPGSIGSPFTGYGEFYWDDSGPGSRNAASAGTGVSAPNYIGHEQTMMGGTFQQSGLSDVAVTIADQFGYGDGGLSRFSNVANNPNITLEANGNLNTTWGVLTYPTVLSDSNSGTGNEAGLALRHTRLYGVNVAGSPPYYWFGKANGLGDVEALSDSAPLQVGNRLWCDTGVSGVGAYNGIQDPGEAGANSVVVRLTCGAEYAEVTTSGSGLAAGGYLFTDTNWNASGNTTSTIIPRNTQCTLSVATTGANATALTNACGGTTLKVPTVPNAQGNTTNNPLQDIRDSDATAVRTAGTVTSAQISFLTGGPGVNNHGLDFGFDAEADYGDAPDPTYPTLAASNGANHVIVAGIRMGALIDSEQDGQPNVAATGDDGATSDDEDGVTLSALAAGQPAVASVNMVGLTGTPVCYLNAWIDFNGNGSWLDAGEKIATNFALNGGAVRTVNFTVPVAVTTSPTYARFRCSTTQNLTPTGSAPDGEVEDYRVTIAQNASLDYGDAPDPTYPTLSTSGGASHVLGAGGPRMGVCVDAEANGQPNGTAIGDDGATGAPVFGTCVNNDDEDGVSGLDGLVEGVASNLTIAVSNATCALNAWIDYNGDGDWNDTGEQIATNAAMVVGNNTWPVTPPAAATQAPTFARFRCSTQSGLGTTGAAADGEVEDYQLSIGAGSSSNDWGDAPDPNYATLGVNNGAHHLMVANVFLGACVDAEANGQPIAGATGDDTNVSATRFGTCAAGTNNDDEDGMTIPTLIAGQTAQLVASRVATTACYLNGWIDFNTDGDWTDTGEQVATNVLLAAGNNNLPVNVPGSAAGGTTYARFRCSTQQNLNPVGVASDGEVEDYAVTITASAADWGDLPDAPYPTLSGSNGAVHVLSSSAFMGKCVDAETNGQPTGMADGDDINATPTRLGVCATTANDDEDGVSGLVGTLNAGSAEQVNIDMSAFNTGAQVCFLNAWIDFNGNGSLTDAGEQIATNVQMIGGAAPNTVNFTIPSVVPFAATGARFRCSTQSGLGPTGSAPNGEVEDYMVTITQQSRDFGDAPDLVSGTGVGEYNTTVADNGPSHLIVANLQLGAVAPDADNGTLQNTAATADDITPTTPDDEDGVTTLPTVKTTSTSVVMNVSVFNNTGSPATLACWIDFNRDGVFGSAERASASVSSDGDANPTLTFSGFGAPVAGISYLRCRLATTATEVDSPIGPASTGEVEDYQVIITVPLPPAGAIGNYIWVDENSDGYQDAGEPGIPNVQVNLKDANGNVIATTTTDSHGGYLFPNLPAGAYFVDVVEATLPAGMSQTPYNLAGADFGNQDQSSGFGYPVTIGGTQPLENLTADFGYNYNPTGEIDGGTGTAALGDRVWIDVNGDGAQQPDEVGVRGVTVQIFTAGPDGVFGTGDDVPGATQTTDTNGYYLFDDLTPGAYVVKVTNSATASHDVLGASYTQTGDPDHFGTTGANNDNMTTAPVVLGPGDVFLNADFGYQPNQGVTLGTIGDTVWFDANASGGDQTTQGSEPGIAGVTVALIRDTNGNGVWDAGEPIIATDTTDASGKYLFTGLSLSDNGDGDATDADYIVWVNDTDAVLTGLAQTYDQDSPLDNRSATALTAVASSDLAQDFSYTAAGQTPTTGLIGDTVWFDLDNSGGNQTTQGAEPGIEGVVMELLDSGGNVIATTTTDENGHYYFGGLPVSGGGISYQTQVAASNFAPGGVLQGMANTYDPDGAPPVDTGALVSLTSAAPVNLQQDFSYTVPPTAQPGRIGNLVWLDANADGVFAGVGGQSTDPNVGTDDDEPVLGNVTLDLYRDLNCNGVVDPSDPRLSTQTTASAIAAGTYGADGMYIFKSLPTAGNPVGNCSNGAAGYVVNVTDTAGGLFGYWHSLGTPGLNNNSQVDPYAAQISTAVPENLTADFGYYVEPACAGNFVWWDNGTGGGTADNGIQDGAEPGINGVTVQLVITWPAGGTTTLQTVTGDNPNQASPQVGWYAFCNLLLDEDYRIGSATTTPGTNQPAHVIAINTTQPALASYTQTIIGAAGSTALNDSNNPAGTVGVPVQGLTNTTQQAAASEPVIASYDFGFKTTPTVVTLRLLQAAPQSPWAAMLELLRQLAQPAVR